MKVAILLGVCAGLLLAGAAAPSCAAPELVLQQGHRGKVGAAAFAPDGRTFVTGGEEGALRLWDAHSGALLGVWQAHRGGVAHLAFAPGGALLASAGRDGKVVLRDARSGAVRHTINADGPLCFSHDGSTLLAASPIKGPSGYQTKPALWDTATGKLRLAFAAPADMGAVALSADGTLCATSTYNLIRLWDARTGKQLRDVQTEDGNTSALAFSPDGALLVSADLEGVAHVRSVTDGAPLRNLTAHLGRIHLVAFLDATTLLTVAGDAARLWDVTTFERRRTIPAPESGFGVVALAADGKSLLCTGGALRILDLQSGQTRQVMPQSAALRDVPHNFGMSPDGKTLTLAIGRSSGKENELPCGEIWVWRAGSVHPAGVGTYVDDDVYQAEPLNGGKVLFSTMGMGVSRCDLVTGKIKSFGDWENGANIVAVSSDGALVAGAYPTRPIQVFEARSGKLLHTFTAMKKPDDQDSWCWLAFAPDNRTLAATDSYNDCIVRLWDCQTGRLRRTWSFSEEVGEVAFTPDGRTMAGSGEHGLVWLWDAAGKTTPRVLRGHQGTANSIAFTRDGRTLASGGKDGTMRIWDVATGKLRRVLNLHLAERVEVNSVRFAPGGALLCAVEDGQIQVWDAAQGQLKLTFRLLPGKANWIAWTPDGFYDAAPGAAPFLRWRDGDKWLNAAPAWHRPDIIARAWGF